MKKLLVAAVAAVVGMAMGPAGAQDMMKVRIGTEGAYPPFNALDSDGKLVGFDIEIGDAMCAAAKLDCEWVVQDWDGILPGLVAEKYDAILASMSVTEERLKKVDFTVTYYKEAAALVGAEGTDVMGSLKDTVAGKIVGVQSATTHENYARDTFGDVAEIKSYDTVEQAHLDLTAGRIDFFTDGAIAVSGGFLDTDLGEGYGVVGETFNVVAYHGEGAGIAVRKGEAELLEALNGAIQAIRDNGEYQKISDKYFGFDVFE
jgi:arginine/ornithine transport system substrate-binding protein